MIHRPECLLRSSYLKNFSCFESPSKSCSEEFTNQKHIISWYDWQDLTGISLVRQPHSAWRTLPFPQVLLKTPFCESQQQCHCHCSMIQVPLQHDIGTSRRGKDLLYFRCIWYKIVVGAPGVPFQKVDVRVKNRRSISGCLYFRGDPCTVPRGSRGEMSHQIRNLILRFTRHKKVLLWLYSSTLPPLQRNKDSISELFLFCCEHSSHTVSEKELSCSGWRN